MEPTLSAYTPTWRDRLAAAMMGDGRPTAERRNFVSGLLGSTGTGSTGLGVVDATPLGGLLGVQEAVQGGDSHDMSLAAIGMLPGANLRKFVFNQPKGLFDAAAYQAASRVDDPAVIARLEGLGWRFPNSLMLRDDNTLTKAGQRNIVDALSSANSKIIADETAKQQKRFLKNIASEYGDGIGQIHKRQELDFTALPVQDYNSSAGVLLHKSPTYNRGQSSEYKLMLVGDDPAYARKSNHWGSFATNIKEGSPEAIAAGLTETDDPFGRVGLKHHNWRLSGGIDDSRSSQAGFVLLRDLLGW